MSLTVSVISVIVKLPSVNEPNDTVPLNVALVPLTLPVTSPIKLALAVTLLNVTSAVVATL